MSVQELYASHPKNWTNVKCNSISTDNLQIDNINGPNSALMRIPIYSVLPVAPSFGHLAYFNGKLYYTDTVTWQEISTGGSGSGDVVGPASSTNNAITRYDGITGKLIKDSLATLDNTGSIDCTNLTALGGVKQYKALFPLTSGVKVLSEFFASTTSVSISNTVETSLLGAGIGTTTIPANSLAVGSSVQLQVLGTCVTTANRTPTIRLKLNGITMTSNVVNIDNTTGVTSTFEYNSYFVIRSAGVGGTAVYNGLFTFNDSGVIKGGSLFGTIAVNTTINNTVDLTLQFDSAPVGTNLTSTIVSIRSF